MAEWQLVLILFVVLTTATMAFNSWFHRRTMAALTKAKAIHIPDVKIVATTKGSIRRAKYNVYLVEGAVLFAVTHFAGVGRPFWQLNQKYNSPRKYDGVWVFAAAKQVKEEGEEVIITFERGLLSTKLRFQSLGKKQRAQMMRAMGQSTKSQLRTTARSDLAASLEDLEDMA